MLDQEDAQHNLIPGAWRTAAITEDLNRPIRGNRDTLKYYLNIAGAVAWQDKMVYTRVVVLFHRSKECFRNH